MGGGEVLTQDITLESWDLTQVQHAIHRTQEFNKLTILLTSTACTWPGSLKPMWKSSLQQVCQTLHASCISLCKSLLIKSPSLHFGLLLNNKHKRD